jgi:putative sterol carrier protein
MKILSKPKRYFLYVAPAPALIFFKIYASYSHEPGHLLLVACLLFIYCLLVVWIAMQWDKPSYFDWITSVYFGLAAISLLSFPGTACHFLGKYGVTGIYLCLFSVAFFPPLMKKDPFTYHYAKKTTPAAYWGNPVFIRINRLMTYVWAFIFALCVILSLYPSVVTRAVVPISIILGLGVPFNIRFPDFYLKRSGLPSLYEQRQLSAHMPEAHMRKKKDSPLPQTAWDAISKMPERFNADAAGDMHAVIEFNVTGAESCKVWIQIKEGKCSLTERPIRKPDLAIETPSEIWLKIVRGELNGQEAFSRQDYTAKGDLGILMKIPSLFD